MRASYLQPSSLQYSSFLKEGGSKAGSSHFNEKFSFRQNTTVLKRIKLKTPVYSTDGDYLVKQKSFLKQILLYKSAGPLTASMIAAARCLIQPSFKIQSILRAILRDEIINWNKKNTSASSSNTGLATNPFLPFLNVNNH